MANLERLSELTKKCGQQNARLIAVSKTKPADEIMKLYRAGHRAFGENRAGELVEKHAALPEDIEWHMIGHLQRNKVKEIVGFVRMIQSVDSLRLAREIDKQAGRVRRNVSVLLQVKIAQETEKYGFDTAELLGILDAGLLQQLPFLQISGLMGMATFTDNREQLQWEFRKLRDFFEEVRERYFKDDQGFREVSMGMSGDHDIALEAGSTMIRVGSALFGAR